jgi:AbrB family looped-hinge helix DNA binding protein
VVPGRGTRIFAFPSRLRYTHLDGKSVQAEIQEKSMEATVQVRQRGTLTLPAELRAKYDIKEGDTFRVIDLDGLLVLTPMAPMLPELAREIERARVEAGLSLDEMLKLLRRQRQRYYREKYRR